MDAIIATFRSPGPEFFQLGPIVLRWYGLLIAIAVLIGLNLSNKLATSKPGWNGVPSSGFVFND